MWDPPPSWVDMLGDADLAPVPDGPYRALTVPNVGVVQARRPMPAATPILAMAANPDIPPEQQHHHLTRFVRDHLKPGEYERILDTMLDGELPANTTTLVARSLATWGTARPYLAIITLAVMAATHWRAVRQRLRSDGIPDPMRDLPSMHAIIDEIETLALEGTASTGDRDRDRLAREDLLDKLYAPEPGPVTDVVVDRKGRRRPQVKPPDGFAPEQIEADFNAATRALAGMR